MVSPDPSQEAAGPTPPAPSRRLPLALLFVVAAGLVLSGLEPYDRPTWILEVAPVLVAIPLLVATARRFPLTPLLYVLIAAHALILIAGGHWTYARVPLGEWARDAFHLSRNPYDRLGHLAQGFVPALVAREVLLRTSPLRRGRWLFSIVLAFVLAVAACYEFLEWWTALASGDGAVQFLGTQGDVWDTQWDMLCALIGGLLAQGLLSRVQDRQMERLLGPSPR